MDRKSSIILIDPDHIKLSPISLLYDITNPLIPSNTSGNVDSSGNVGLRVPISKKPTKGTAFSTAASSNSPNSSWNSSMSLWIDIGPVFQCNSSTLFENPLSY